MTRLVLPVSRQPFSFNWILWAVRHKVAYLHLRRTICIHLRSVNAVVLDSVDVLVNWNILDVGPLDKLTVILVYEMGVNGCTQISAVVSRYGELLRWVSAWWS